MVVVVFVVVLLAPLPVVVDVVKVEEEVGAQVLVVVEIPETGLLVVVVA